MAERLPMSFRVRLFSAPSVYAKRQVCFPPPQERDIHATLCHNEDILLYRKLLAETTDEEKRKVVLKLLAEEEAKELLCDQRIVR